MSHADVASWVGAFIIAKVLRDDLKFNADRFGPSVILYYLVGLVAIALAAHIDLTAAGAIALVFRLAMFYRERVLGISNHYYLETLALTVTLALATSPGPMLAVLQALTVSVWLFSVWQKLYHREFADGTFFYFLFSIARLGGDYPLSRLLRRAMLLPTPQPIEAPYQPVVPAFLSRCRQHAVLALVAETAAPLFALAFSGSPVATASLVLLSIPVALLSFELDYMVINMILAFAFLVPFDMAALREAWTAHPVITVLLTWVLIWPIVHGLVTKHLRMSNWFMFGWGMYSTFPPEAFELMPQGTLRQYPGARTKVLRLVGDCRADSVRRFVFRCCFPAGGPLSPGAVALVMRKRLRTGATLVSRYTVLADGVPPAELMVVDEVTRAAFERHLHDVCERRATPAAA